MTACRECKHAALDRQCLASPITTFDYWKGSGQVATGQFHWCTEINKGDCGKFERNEPVSHSTSNGS